MKKLFIGTMSGTSVDGLDVCIISIDENEAFELIDYKEYKYDQSQIDRILKAANSKANTKEINILNFELAKFYANSIIDIISRNNLESKDITAIGSHGQTIYHISNPKEGEVKSTFQIVDGSVIAGLTGIDTVSDFRPAHIAAGGEGAPLVNFAEHYLFNNSEKQRIWQNIGGISNSTVLSKDINSIIAFDNGPGNMIIDFLAKELFGVEFDEGGKIASQGKINQELLDKLTTLDYYSQPIPKSTGRELYDDEYCKWIISLNYDKFDTLRTVTYLTSWSIANSLKEIVAIDSEIIVSGGGAYNEVIMNDLKDLMPNTNVMTADKMGINSAAKEAIIFAYYAHRTINRKHSAIVNGKEVILGKVSYV